MQPKCMVSFRKAEECRTYSFNNIVDQLLCFVDLVLAVCHDKTMQVLLLVACVRGVGTTFTLFHGPFSTNCDFGARVLLHGFERVTTRTDQ